MANDANGATITQVTIKATADTSSAQRSIKNLAEKLRSLKTAVGEGIQLPSAKKIEAFGTAMASLKDVKWKTIANGMNEVADAMERIATAMSAISEAKGALGSLRGLSNAMSKATQTPQNLANAVANASPINAGSTAVTGGSVGGHFLEGILGGGQDIGHLLSNWGFPVQLGGGAYDTSNMVASFANFGEEVYKANAAVITFNANAKLLSGVVKIIKTIGSVAATTLKVLSKFSSIVGKVAVNFAKLTASVAIAPWKRLGSSVKDVVTRLTGFFTALKRIAVYRAIRWALKELTQAFKEGMENLYQYSLLIDGQFAKSMDMLATSALYAKNSLAAMASPIVNVLAPAVDMLVDEFVDLLNTVNELLASLTGAETWTKALKYPKAYAEAADGANGKAKELRATLLGFDEINRLDDNKRGSRGSAAEELDYSKMFEEQTVSTKAKDYVKAIKDAFAKGDFTDIGKSIGKKIKKGLDSIDWASIESAVTRNASSVATLINGFVDVDGLGTTIGSSIAKAFNVAVTKMQTFFGTVRWDKVGKFLADGINGILQTFDTAKLGQNLATIVNSAVTLIHNFTSNVRWSEVGSFVARGINNFLATIKGRDIGETIAGIINNAVQLIHGFTSSVKWSEFGKFLSDGINGFFNKIKTKDLAETISTAIKNALSMVHEFFKDTDFNKIGSKIGELIKGLKWKEILSGLGQVLVDALKGALDIAKNLLASDPAFATALAAFIAYKISVALGAASITSTIAGAMGKSVTAGAVSSGTLIAQGSSGIGAAASAALGVLGGVAMVWVADKITDGETTKILEDALGITITNATIGAVEKTKEEMYSDLDRVYNKWKDKHTTTAITVDPIGTLQGIIDKLDASIKSKSNKPNLNYTKAYAAGGTPQTGSLFLAGESGAELVYATGSGTTVANRDQIADSVASGNEESNELLREQNALLRSLLAKDTTVVTNITTGQITSALNRANVRNGSMTVPVALGG